MAIKKENVRLEITFPKEEAEQLETIVESFKKEGVKNISKSKVMLVAFRGYLEHLVTVGKSIQEAKKEKRGNKKDA